jgi:uncharacterized protein YkvS
MALRERIEYLRKEHQELLHLASRIDKMLETASKNDFAEHLKSLNELRSFEHGLAGIVEHCHSENRIVESTYHENLREEECARIDAEHKQIIRAVSNFREELKFATVDRTMAMILPGLDLVNLLRAHIAYERELLDRIAQTGKSSQKAVGKRKPVKRSHERKKRHTTRRKPEIKSPSMLPYTLEPHPEL